jgi:formylglycine-generating enzyme required for sulfatase activity
MVMKMSSIIGRNWLVGVLLVAAILGPAESSAKPAADAFKHFRDCENCPEMVVLPGGGYLMGATEEEFKGEDKYRIMYLGETPRHKVDVKIFAIAKFSVTRKQFGIFADETGFDGKGCTVFNGKKWIFDSGASWRSPGFKQTDQDPVVCVSWDDTQKYITWLNSDIPNKKQGNYRLPTEEEWEYAARAGTVTSSYWGGNPLEQCKYENARDLTAKMLDPNVPFADCADGYITTAPVGSLLSNPWGLFDMLGNVNQWISDCSTLGYSDGSIAVAREGVKMFGCPSRVLRGASWASIPIAVHSANRAGGAPNMRNSANGFRLAADVSN